MIENFLNIGFKLSKSDRTKYGLLKEYSYYPEYLVDNHYTLVTYRSHLPSKLVYIMFRTHSIIVPKEHLRKQSHYVTQMAKSYFQQDDMMETKQKTITYCDKLFINQQKELVKQMWNL